MLLHFYIAKTLSSIMNSKEGLLNYGEHEEKNQRIIFIHCECAKTANSNQFLKQQMIYCRHTFRKHFYTMR